MVRALGFGSDDEIIDMLGGNSEGLSATIDKDVHKNPEDSRVEEALKDIYERLRPGEPKTADSARNLLTARPLQDQQETDDEVPAVGSNAGRNAG